MCCTCSCIIRFRHDDNGRPYVRRLYPDWNNVTMTFSSLIVGAGPSPRRERSRFRCVTFSFDDGVKLRDVDSEGQVKDAKKMRDSPLIIDYPGDSRV